MIPCDAGDVVLLRFPFTDLSSVKRRPAIVLSSGEFSASYADLVVMPITGQDQGDDSLLLAKWAEAGLVKRSWLKPLIGTLDAGLVQRRLGTLNREDYVRVGYALSLLIDARFRP